MGWYTDRVLPRLLDSACAASTLEPLRRRVCAGLAGDVAEIGFGSGLNLPHLPAAVTSVAAVEPSDVAWRLAGPRVAASRVPVRRVGLDGPRLPLPDGGVDAVLSTWTLCTIPDAARALAEVRRVLKPGGRLHVVEHGLAPDEAVRRWQRQLEPVQRRLVGGCHLTRSIDDLLSAAGFDLVEVDRCYADGEPKFLGATTLAIATPGR